MHGLRVGYMPLAWAHRLAGIYSTWCWFRESQTLRVPVGASIIPNMMIQCIPDIAIVPDPQIYLKLIGLNMCLGEGAGRRSVL